MDRDALAAFLRTHRESLRPEDVGLAPGPRRRVAGLRREEVARLATMSVEYYTRLEQARGPQPSPQMLSAITRVLRLSVDERDHLFRLAGHPAPERGAASVVAAPLLRVLDRLDDTPALIISELDETLAQNRLAQLIFGDRMRFTGREASGAWRWFMLPDEERRAYRPDDHDRQSRAIVANLRAVIGRRGPRSAAAGIAADLEQHSPEFARIWALQEVHRRFEDHKILLAPEVGPIAFDCQVLLTEDQSQALLTLTVPARTPDAERLQLLALVGDLAAR